MAKRSDNLDLDFIGKLPDCLLLHIVSLLPYKEASRTAVLSTRWRRVLPSSKIVSFDDRELGLDTGFAEFSSELIRNYKEPFMDKFSITLSESSPEEFAGELRGCVAFAVEKKARAILLDFSGENGGPEFELSAEVYGHKALESLRLFSCGFVASEFRNFDSLSHISLGRIELSSDCLATLLGTCSSLTSLRLEKCRNTGIVEIKGRGLRFESLVVQDCDLDRNWIEIEAPSLKVLKYSGEFCNFELGSTRRLEEAVFDFGAELEFGEVGDLLFQLFRDLYAVKVLTVCSYVLQIIPSGEEPLGLNPRLKYVKHLILKTTMHENELYGIRFFLHSCPSLHTLTIEVNPSRKIFEEYESPFEETWSQAMPVYSCVKKNLKVVNVNGFRGNDEEIRLLAYFVYSCRVLEILNVEVGEDSEKCLKKARILQFVKKASPKVQISMSSRSLRR